MSFPRGSSIGWRYTVPLIDMDLYLPYLQDRLTAAGGTIRQHSITDLSEAARHAPVVVNATGLGARDLAGDTELTPIRGQLVVMDNPGITEFFTEDTGWSPDLLHLYPHGDRLVLGGVAQDGELGPSAQQGYSRGHHRTLRQHRPAHCRPARQGSPGWPAPDPADDPVRSRPHYHWLPSPP